MLARWPQDGVAGAETIPRSVGYGQCCDTGLHGTESGYEAQGPVCDAAGHELHGGGVALRNY